MIAIPTPLFDALCEAIEELLTGSTEPVVIDRYGTVRGVDPADMNALEDAYEAVLEAVLAGQEEGAP